MTQLAKTSTPGIYRAHGAKCNGTSRCDCPYVIMWRHRGRQHKETCRTFNEAREKKALRDSVDSKPMSGLASGTTSRSGSRPTPDAPSAAWRRPASSTGARSRTSPCPVEDPEAQRDRAERRPRALDGDAKRRQEHLAD
jgi:hypothetical protein